MDIAKVPRQAWQSKLAKGFSAADVALEFGLLWRVGEASPATD